MNNADQILELLKTRGPLSAAELGDSLGITSMGARRHLQALADQELVYWQENIAGRGRPKRSWYLTARAMQRFPDRHAELSLQLIESVTELFGEQGLEKLINQREQQQLAAYQNALETQQELSDKIATLAALRRTEGYMADWQALDDGSFVLLEHHCPICAAATACRGFCRSELEIFQTLLAEQAQVEREQHLLNDDLRCSYRITPI